MSQQQYGVVAFIGRFQPVHHGHVAVIKQALQQGEHVIILIGSADQPRTLKNPWTWQERESLIRNCFTEQENSRISVTYLYDTLYNNTKWISDVTDKVTTCLKELETSNRTIALIGHHKDSSSWYLDHFPSWKLIEVPNHEKLDSTTFRKSYFHNIYSYWDNNDPWGAVNSHMIDHTNHQWLTEFMYSDEYKLLMEEQDFYRKHDEIWSTSPYAPTFNCSDAVIFQAGHVLLIKRKFAPGKGCFAIPGGYIDGNETAYEAAIRELKEETRIKAPIPVLNGSWFAERLFDHPERSLRGRIFSHAFAFHLKQLDADGNLQTVKGNDDAVEAFWVPLHRLQTPEYRSRMFEDHGDIIQHFVDQLND